MEDEITKEETQDETQVRIDGALGERIEEFKQVWSKRNRDGGLHDSVQRFASARIGAAAPAPVNQ